MDAINQRPIDRFTLGHLLFGVAMGAAGVQAGPAVAVAIGWEIIEGPIKFRVPAVFPHPSPDSLPNASLDAAAMVLGWWVVAG